MSVETTDDRNVANNLPNTIVVAEETIMDPDSPSSLMAANPMSANPMSSKSDQQREQYIPSCRHLVCWKLSLPSLAEHPETPVPAHFITITSIISSRNPSMKMVQ